jgi:hypothetical protein
MEYREEDGWTVTTPVIASNMRADIDKASECEHPGWGEISRTVSQNGLLSLVETCTECIAVRSRFRRATDTEVEEWEHLIKVRAETQKTSGDEGLQNVDPETQTTSGDDGPAVELETLASGGDDA